VYYQGAAEDSDDELDDNNAKDGEMADENLEDDEVDDEKSSQRTVDQDPNVKGAVDVIKLKISAMNMDQLKSELNGYGQTTLGNKTALQKRVKLMRDTDGKNMLRHS
jgi:hypothetical protein